ncbi:MAG: methyltransferase domain-containing protein [Terracoccus sp.]
MTQAPPPDPRPAAPAAWDPDQYARFADHRSRPFHDLLARVGPVSPQIVVDLGCGPGELTRSLAEQWPEARVVGIDSSPEMIERAREGDAPGHPPVEWVLARAQEWDPASLDARVDLLVTNATLQWVPHHLPLLTRWFAALAPGGTLALQVPANLDAPSHALMRDAAQRHTRAADLGPALDRSLAVAAPETYAALLLAEGAAVDVWQTTYQHVLPVVPGRRHPVLEWVRGTGLRPVLGVLTDPDEREAFLADYEQALELAYPRMPFGVLFPFTRTFAVARRP